MEPYSSNPWLCSSSSSLAPQPEGEWSWEENKVFEDLLAEGNLDSPFLFEEIACQLPSKTPSQIKQHYEALVRDLDLIESDNFFPLPEYFSCTGDGASSDGGKVSKQCPTVDAENINKASTHQPRRKGVPWTPEEHEDGIQRPRPRVCYSSNDHKCIKYDHCSYSILFLQGLEKYGKGDWRSIARFCVVTRTPAQVASHAQKHFLRLQNSHKPK